MSDEVESGGESSSSPVTRVTSTDRGDVSWRSYKNQWNENHGTALMAFAGLVFVVGGTVIFYQQNRFQPPRFPTSGVIQSVQENLVEMSEDPDASESGNSESLDVDSNAPTALNASEVAGMTRLIVSGAAQGGFIRIAIYHSVENFNDSPRADWKTAISPDADGQGTFDLPARAVTDRFAIAAYHDKNDNEELDRNALGIPTERYGFSNSARGRLGPPGFDEAAIDRPAAGDTIELEIW